MKRPQSHKETYDFLEQFSTAISSEKRQLVVDATGFACVDAFDNEKRAFQVTLNLKHTLKELKWEEILGIYPLEKIYIFVTV